MHNWVRQETPEIHVPSSGSKTQNNRKTSQNAITSSQKPPKIVIYRTSKLQTYAQCQSINKFNQSINAERVLLGHVKDWPARDAGLLGHVKDWQQRAALLGSGVATAGRGGMSVLAIDELVDVEESKQKVN